MTEFWCDLRSSTVAEFVERAAVAANHGVDVVLVDSNHIAACGLPLGRFRVVSSWDADGSDPEPGDWFISDDLATARSLMNRGVRVVLEVTVSDSQSMNDAAAAIGEVDVLLVTLLDPTNIPLELLLAEAQSAPGSVVKLVGDVDDAIISSGVLEAGVSGIAVRFHDLEQLAVMAKSLAALEVEHFELGTVVVTSVEHVGMGYRACIDTVSLMTATEGMVVGSTSSGGILICAEVHHLPYMNLRPFRVNAGAVHSYVWAPAGRTEYVTDLSAGSRVMAIDHDGRARPVTVGRVKTEIRPLRLIRGEIDGREVNVFIQDDWHVRVMGAEGTPINCSEIRAGTELRGFATTPGRHVGIKVNETIMET